MHLPNVYWLLKWVSTIWDLFWNSWHILNDWWILCHKKKRILWKLKNKVKNRNWLYRIDIWDIKVKVIFLSCRCSWRECGSVRCCRWCDELCQALGVQDFTSKTHYCSLSTSILSSQNLEEKKPLCLSGSEAILFLFFAGTAFNHYDW